METTTPNNSPCWYAMSQTGDEAEIRIYEPIGAWGISASRFVEELSRVTAKTINLRLNTPGGEVFDATAIYNGLKAHSARVVAHVDGVAASAGSVIAMAADEVRMADNAYLMIHNAWGGVMGDAREISGYAELLEKMNDNIAGTYHGKAGKGKAHWRKLMDAETWFTAAEAKAEGLADTITKHEPKESASNRIASSPFNFASYTNIPAPVREMWGIPTPTQSQPPSDSPRGEPSPAQPQEKSVMADSTTNQAAPAQNPAPANNGIPQGNLNTVAEINQQTIQHYVAQGKSIGKAEGAQAEIERFKRVVAATPGRPDIAVNAFLAGHDEQMAAMLFNVEKQAEAKAQVAADQLKLENARLQNLIATGGFAGGVGMGVTGGSSTAPASNVPTGLSPEEQAKLEWDSDPSLRAKHGNEKRYTLYRVNQLKGNVAVLKTA